MDDNGYPEQDEINKIRFWPSNDFDKLLDYCMELWKWPDYTAKNGRRYSFSTGGWSGNEDIIEALQENKLFWMTCWQNSHRGGHYKFIVPKWEKKGKP